ncbi:MAG: hypothetical protein D6805_06040 [Planctomycetota bacterium]|nr:MAG: hypothetical protein D6805_06040 [Planctomycetota bacterium]
MSSTQEITPADFAKNIWEIACTKGEKGVRDFYAAAIADQTPLDAAALAIHISEIILPLPNVRTALRQELPAALQKVANDGQFDLLLQGLAVAVQLQLAEGHFEDVLGTLNSLQQLALQEEREYYRFLGAIFEADLLWEKGERERALQELEQLRRESEQLAEREILHYQILSRLLRRYSLMGAWRALQRAFDAFRELFEAEDVAILAFYQGVLAFAKGFWKQARDSFQAVLEYSQNEFDKTWALEALFYLAQLDLRSSETYLVQAEELARNVGYSQFQERLCFTRARIFLELGRYADAVQMLDILEKVEEADFLLLCAEICARVGKNKRAKDFLKRLKPLAQVQSLWGALAYGYLLEASLEKEFPLRQRNIEQAKSYFQTIGDGQGYAKALCQEAMLEIERENYHRAGRIIPEILEGVEQIPPPLLMQVEFLCGLAALRCGLEREARPHLEHALKIAKKFSFIPMVVECLKALGKKEEALRLEAKFRLSSSEET